MIQKNYLQEDEIVVHKPQSQTHQPMVLQLELPSQQLVEPVEPNLPEHLDFDARMNHQINLFIYKEQDEDPYKWFTCFERWSMFMKYNYGLACHLSIAFPFESMAKTWYDTLSDTN